MLAERVWANVSPLPQSMTHTSSLRTKEILKLFCLSGYPLGTNAGTEFCAQVVVGPEAEGVMGIYASPNWQKYNGRVQFSQSHEMDSLIYRTEGAQLI